MRRCSRRIAAEADGEVMCGDFVDDGKHIVFFLCHKINQEIKRRFVRLKHQLPIGHKAVFLFSSGAAASRPDWLDESEFLLLITREVMGKTFASRLRESAGHIISGNIDQVFIAAALQRPSADYYWLVEYDVVFRGHWSAFFGDFGDVACDFLGTSFYKKTDMPNWYWWKYFRWPQDGMILEEEKIIRCFVPLMRLSRPAIIFLAKVYSKERWQGHTECLLPTLLFRYGFTIEDIGGNSFLTPEQRKGKWYDNRLVGGQVLSGPFSSRPIMTRPGWRRNRLYHPAKTPRRQKIHVTALNALHRILAPW